MLRNPRATLAGPWPQAHSLLVMGLTSQSVLERGTQSIVSGVIMDMRAHRSLGLR